MNETTIFKKKINPNVEKISSTNRLWEIKRRIICIFLIYIKLVFFVRWAIPMKKSGNPFRKFDSRIDSSRKIQRWKKSDRISPTNFCRDFYEIQENQKFRRDFSNWIRFSYRNKTKHDDRFFNWKFSLRKENLITNFTLSSECQ